LDFERIFKRLEAEVKRLPQDFPPASRRFPRNSLAKVNPGKILPAYRKNVRVKVHVQHQIVR
jgi:hypothetical protein